MRILHFCMHAPFTENYSYQDNLLPEYQHKHGHKVRIITTTKSRGAEGEYIYTNPEEKTLSNGVELVRLQVKSKIQNAFGIYKGANKQMDSFSPDMIFIHGLDSFLPRVAIKYKKASIKTIHIVADNHQDYWNTKDLVSKAIVRLFRCFWLLWIKKIDKVFGTTSWRITYAHNAYGIPYEKLDLLLMGIDADKITDKSSIRIKYREKYVLDNNFVFVTGGKINKNKCTIEAMKAFTRIKDENARFMIFGSLDDDIKEMFSDLCECDKRIMYLGYIKSEEASNLFLAADFGVFPNSHSVLWEEAIGCGLPCLFHRYEEKDHTEVCGNCICIEQSDEDTIYCNMKKVLEDKEYYAQLKANAEKASNEFSYHTIAEKSVECCYEDKK